jgi:geranylgeranyl diphosphate synthase type II
MVRSTALPSRIVDTIREITDAIGLDGMLGGQVADVTGEKRPPSKELVQYIHSRKTGKFIRASLKVGGIIAGADEETLKVFHEVGEKIGLTFQIVDDILDEIGEKDKLGKSVGKDRESGKQTYVRVFGLEEAKVRARELAESAIEQINSYFGEEKGLPLTSLTKFIIERNF